MKKFFKILNISFSNASVLVFEYCFNIFGLKTYFGDDLWKWLVLFIPGIFIGYIYTENSNYITRWVLGRLDEVEENNQD